MDTTMNKKIVVSGIAIMGFGLADSIQKGSTNQMKVFQGTLILLIILSLMDAIDERLGKVAGGIAIVALIGATLSFFAPGKSQYRDKTDLGKDSTTSNNGAVFRDKTGIS